MIGDTAEYVRLVASSLPGQKWEYYADELPLAIGLQLRNTALYQAGVNLITPGRTAEAKVTEILGDHASEWILSEHAIE